MASLQLGAVSLINDSWVVFGSSLKLRIGFRTKRFRRVSERWRFRVQQMSGKEQMSTQELARFAKRSESLRRILKQYGVSVEKPEDNKTSGSLDDLNCEVVPCSVIEDSSMNTTEELRRQEMYSETVSTAENLSGKNQHNLPHLNTGVLFSCLLPVLGFCIICIIGTLHTIISKKTSRVWNEPLASSNSSSPEYRVGLTNQEGSDEVNEAYSRVELEYKRFLLECGLSES